MQEDRRTIGTIVAASVAGYALGLLPLLTSRTEDIRLVFGSIALIFVGSLLIPGIAASAIVASPGGQHRAATVVLIVAESMAIIVGVLSGGLSPGSVWPVVLVVALMTIGASIGYWIGDRVV